MNEDINAKKKDIGRYSFYDYFGLCAGVENVDDLSKAYELAVEYQCEIIDIQATESPVVYSVWEGWNPDYDFYPTKEMGQYKK